MIQLYVLDVPEFRPVIDEGTSCAPVLHRG